MKKYRDAAEPRELQRPTRDSSGRSEPAGSPRALLVLMTVVVLLGCKKESATVPEEPAPVVQGDEVVFRTNALQLGSLESTNAAPRTLAVTHVTGRLYWNDETTVRIFSPVFGRVKKITADLGDAIAAGAPLAELDSPDYAQALASARAAVGNLMAADKALLRTKSLLAHGAYAVKDVEAAEAAYIAALAERDRAKAVIVNFGGGDRVYTELERAESGDRSEASSHNYGGNDDGGNSHYFVRSPLSGVLVDKGINPGQEIRADSQNASFLPYANSLFVVGDPTTLWLQVDVGEADLPALQPGLKLQITCKAYPGKVFGGVIDKIQATMDPLTRTVKIRGTVNNPDKLLKAEMYVVVDVVRDLGNVVAAGVDVPAKALFMKGGDSYLFIEESPGRYKRQKVTVGVEKDDVVPVFEGVGAGQKVVVEGALLLQAVLEPAS